MSDKPENGNGRRTVDIDVRQAFLGVLGVLVAVVGLLATNAMGNLKDSVAQASQKMDAAVKTLNEHSTQLATMELRIRVLETQQDAGRRTQNAVGRAH